MFSLWSRSTREGHSYGLFVTMSDGSPVSYNDTFISHGVANTVIFQWSRSLNSGNSSSPWRVSTDGSSSLFNDALHSYGVASQTSDWSRSLKDCDSGGLWVILLVGDTHGALGWAGQYAHGVADRPRFVVEEGSGR